MSALITKRPRASHIFERQPEDHYVEPLWVSERLFEILDLPAASSVWDPACGFGRIVRAAAAHGHDALGTDIKPRWIGNPDGPHNPAARFHTRDFFGAGFNGRDTDMIVSNPPFDRAQEFADLALARTRRMVALLLPTKWLNGAKRARWRQSTPLHLVMPINPRPSMPPGHVLLAGEKAGGGTVDFAWFVWLHGYRGKPMVEECLLGAVETAK
jgi:hypothetical protein